MAMNISLEYFSKLFFIFGGSNLDETNLRLRRSTFLATLEK
jgi:hypothetical protein